MMRGKSADKRDLKHMIELVIDDEQWRDHLLDADALVAQCYGAAIKLEAALDGEIVLLLTGDRQVQDLNKTYRGKDVPTNVLSFPGGDGDFIGDIALARETCLGEAKEQSITVRDHAAHLIVHGMLHLIGYDHENDAEADLMEAKEAAILESMGIANPYAGPMETQA
jgi:probable rRNA maturation factor